ncbi:MAG: chemotaxis protein CheA [Peptostreptococcales bacterium]
MGEERDPMIGVFVYETYQLLEQLERVILASEKEDNMQDTINEIFRIMHTIKGNSMMMKYDNIANLAHATEDLFDFLRTKQPENVDYALITDILLAGIDYFKEELSKIEKDDSAHSETSPLIETIVQLLESLKSVNFNKNKQNFYIKLMFEEEAQMENIRAFRVVHNLTELGCTIYHYPVDLEDGDKSIRIIKKDGFQLAINCEQTKEELEYYFNRVSFIMNRRLEEISKEELDNYKTKFNGNADEDKESAQEVINHNTRLQKYIHVNVDKLDTLMNLVGELVVSESMVTQNPELKQLNIKSIEKASSQMRKIINEIQDVVMEIRMVPLSATFQKMHRIVRDICTKTNKEVELVLSGQETEVDKNIIEHIADPLMHLIRNAIDHGIEMPEERASKGKPRKGTVILEARNSGGDVWIIVRDDGKGLDKERILTKAEERGMLRKSKEDYSDKEVYNMIFNPGFSTKNEVTNYSGRGVGMDAVLGEMERIGGIVLVDSHKDEGSTITLKIPLTLAIIDGMIMQVGKNKFTLPITSIREAFKGKKKDIIQDAEGNSMVMVRGKCYSIIKLHERYGIKTDSTDLEHGIFVMLENEEYNSCIFVDQLIGEGQLVVKSLSSYIRKIPGISGCAHLADGGICLILDPVGLVMA